MRENEHFSSFGEEEERKGVVAAARKEEDGEKTERMGGESYPKGKEQNVSNRRSSRTKALRNEHARGFCRGVRKASFCAFSCSGFFFKHLWGFWFLVSEEKERRRKLTLNIFLFYFSFFALQTCGVLPVGGMRTQEAGGKILQWRSGRFSLEAHKHFLTPFFFFFFLGGGAFLLSSFERRRVRVPDMNASIYCSLTYSLAFFLFLFSYRVVALIAIPIWMKSTSLEVHFFFFTTRESLLFFFVFLFTPCLF